MLVDLIPKRIDPSSSNISKHTRTMLWPGMWRRSHTERVFTVTRLEPF